MGKLLVDRALNVQQVMQSYGLLKQASQTVEHIKSPMELKDRGKEQADERHTLEGVAADTAAAEHRDTASIPSIPNAQNLNKNMMPHATVMAETRAIVRCLRILTGCSYTSYEEMQEADFNGNHVGNTVSEFKPMSATELLAQESNQMSREELIKAIAQFMTIQPYKGIIDLFCKEKKIGMFTGLNDDDLKALHKKVMEKMKGQ